MISLIITMLLLRLFDFGLNDVVAFFKAMLQLSIAYSLKLNSSLDKDSIYLHPTLPVPMTTILIML